jgi:hypothetical protein
MPANNSSNFADNDEMRAFWKATVESMVRGDATSDVQDAVTTADELAAEYLKRVAKSA